MKKMKEILLAIAATLVLSILITSLVGNTVEGYFVVPEEEIQNVDKIREAEEQTGNTDSQLLDELANLEGIIKSVVEGNQK